MQTKQALRTLTQLHAELAGKIKANTKMGEMLRAQTLQVKAVIKMLKPGFKSGSSRTSVAIRAILGSDAVRCTVAPWTCCGSPKCPSRPGR